MNRQKGSALATALVVIVLIAGTTGAFIGLTVVRSEQQAAQLEAEKARRVLAGAVAIKIAELQRESSNMAAVSGKTPDGIYFAVKPVSVAGAANPMVRIGGYCESGASNAKVLVIAKQNVAAVKGSFRGGVVAFSDIDLNGNITIDGRDYTYAGTALSGEKGVLGVSTNGRLSVGGSSQVGGSGPSGDQPPIRGENENNREERAYGIDRNGDGEISGDEVFPKSPDAIFGESAGTLANAARASGTYFADAISWTAYLAAHSSQLPGGVVFYLDFDARALDINFPATMNNPPSVFVNHVDGDGNPATGPDGISTVGNIHGSFRGVMIVDGVKHFNGGFNIVGGVYSLAGQQYGNVFGNGNATIRFSKAVMNQLPKVPKNGQPYAILSWTEEGANLGESPVSEAVALVTNLKASVR
jgi:hypothetical protein